ncbi:MAG: hypothetical protein ACLGHN_15480 [Bacteriovoracia bacterium]
MQKLMLLLNILFLSCADLTTSGARVRYVESPGSALEVLTLAEEIASKNNCEFLGYINADAALFPGSYSLQDNEIHAALRNRAAKIGANLVVANFYRKPPRGIGLSCPLAFLSESYPAL